MSKTNVLTGLLDQVLDMAQQVGMKWTTRRIAIVILIASESDHPSAHDIHSQLFKKCRVCLWTRFPEH